MNDQGHGKEENDRKNEHEALENTDEASFSGKP